MRRTENVYDEELRETLEFWDTGSLNGALMNEIENLDKAHKRAKKELRKQQKAIEQRNKDLHAYAEWMTKTFEEVNKLESKNKHMEKACDAYYGENKELKYANEKLNRMLKNRDVYIEHLKKKIEKMQRGEVD